MFILRYTQQTSIFALKIRKTSHMNPDTLFHQSYTGYVRLALLHDHVVEMNGRLLTLGPSSREAKKTKLLT